MSFVERVQQKPLTVLTLFTIVVTVGILMAGSLSVALMPDVSIPVVAVYTIYSGASPEEVENEVIIPLEEGLSSISGLDKLTSTSSENFGLIIMMFESGVDPDDAADDVDAIVKQKKMGFPDDVDDPILWQFDPDALPIMDLTLYGDRPIDELGKLAEDVVKPALERISGVAQVEITGNRDKEVHVDIDKNRLGAYNLSLQMVHNMISQQNLSLNAGTLTSDGKDFILTSKGAFDNLEQIEGTVIHRVNMGQSGQTHEVLIRDIGDVSMGWAEEENEVLINGKEGISLSIVATEEANIVELAKEVKANQDDINAQLPHDVHMEILSDESVQVEQVLNQVINSAIVGVILAVIVLAIFLGRWNSTLIVSLSIPVSIMITIAGLAVAGKTFNILTLGGLLLGVGMIVDGSIVVLENIDKYHKKGILAKTASLIGTREMISPVTGSILTSISVFLPMFVMKKQMGIMGEFFGDLSLTVILSLSSSLLVAVVLIPVLSSITSKDELGAENKKRNPFSAFIDKILEGLQNVYMKALNVTTKHKWKTVLVSLILLVGSFALVPSIGLVFNPETEPDSVILQVTLPTGTSLDTTKQLMSQLQQVVFDEIKGYKSVIATSGGDNAFEGNLKIVLPPLNERITDAESIKNILRKQFDLYPQADFSFTNTSDNMGQSDADIQIRLIGQDLELVTSSADEIVQIIRDNVNGLTEITSSASQGLPEIEFKINRARAYDLGLSTSGIAQELRGQITGLVPTTFKDGEDSLDIVVRLKEADRNSIIDLDNLYVMNSYGEKVAVSNFAELVRSETPAKITREDQVRSINVTANLLPGYAANFVQGKVEAAVAENFETPDGVRIEYGGSFDDISESMRGMLVVMIVAILLVFGVMVSQFESLRAPFIIFLAMPTMFTGVILAFYLTGIPFSLPAMIGVIMLAGIIVNNGIILVDYINLLRKRGEPLHEAIVNAGGSRIRPVLMTTLTTVLAMIPMAFFPGEGAEMLQPLGLTVVGGLTFNTVTTLFVVPALYALFYSRQAALKEIDNEKN
ncbi:efflux RND transporter permease subunit [Spirochaeta cellobiosiphila]|uniref:efflux RND transporter permease subunit n=1 Tax=Spirochaeta cellobiosiphila TaxID=504483 RepID=UPI0003FEFAF3|nr:efflux RND transporter permease subunit [Spirochaeta cellobiosiphila]